MNTLEVNEKTFLVANRARKDHDSVVVQWFGDISLNGQLCSPQYYEPIRSQMSALCQRVRAGDVRVANFEAPLWGDGSVNDLRRTRICTTKEAAESILPLGLDLVFLGNNHVYDCREKGFENTIAFLQENGIKFLGAGTSRHTASQPIILKKEGISLGFLNYVHRNTNPTIPSGAGVFPNYFEERAALEAIAYLARKVDVVLVYLHWGAEELIRLPSPQQRSFGRRAIEEGATVVVFDHAHCLQPHESWQNGHILYGLGNFIFGDVDGARWLALTWPTAIANIEVSRGRVNAVGFYYLCCRDNIPGWDGCKFRSRSHQRLTLYLRAPKHIYACLYRWEKLYQLGLMRCLRFVEKAGGIIPSLFRLRKRHFITVFETMLSLFRKSSSTKASGRIHDTAHIDRGA